MYHGGIKRADKMMSNAEDKGRAVDNPYAKEVLNEYVLPLANALAFELDMSKAGRQQAHAALLKGMDPEAVAYLAVRTAFNEIFKDSTTSHRTIGYAIGRTIHNELVLGQIEDFNPELYYTLTKDFARRMSKDERHRMTVFKMQARDAGIIIVEWPVGARDQVGLYLLGMLQASGLVDIGPEVRRGTKTLPREVSISESVLERINQVKDFIAITMPVYGPCVEQPVPWTAFNEGGYHTRELRRTHPMMVRSMNASRASLYRDVNMPTVLSAVNALQATRWQVNTEVLDLCLQVAKHFNAGEVLTPSARPKPSRADWMDTVQTGWTEGQQNAFVLWKRRVADWHTTNKIEAGVFNRFYSATRTAEMFRAYPHLHFVYFGDSRGRLYPMTYGLNPQGSDLQRGLLRFAEGKPVDTPEAVRWFHVQGANKFGFDKATLAERHQWVVDRQDLILGFATDPIGNNEWKNADNPIQFLAWCLEYRRWVEDTTGSFLSYLPISMDGSCNGLQNLSALLRDEVGGEATNLTPNLVMQDIYKRVATAAEKRLSLLQYNEPLKDSLRDRWIAHGVGRTVVKRSVMTTPYGVTKRSAADYVTEDYLKKTPGTPFQSPEFMRASSVLMDAVWPAIGDVVVKGREAMTWLQRCARCIIRTSNPDNPVISWTSPSGFPASQSYFESEVHRIPTRLHGIAKVRVHSETDTPDIDRHANGLAPNFVHSMDAAHLHLTTAACARRGITGLAMIHDDYGTHAADAQALYTILREEFVRMYEEHDPIAEFYAKYPQVPPPPEKGALDIRGVLDSAYFFS